MNTVQVRTACTYPVLIGSGALTMLEQNLSLFPKAVRAAVISDSSVWPLWGDAVENQLADAGLMVSHFVFPAGESSKNGSTYLEILNFLAEQELTRTDFLVALGGGVTGDLAGFAAATYLRGIPFVQIPTTLLAMVDSSVGGKTAIDLPAGKNLAGAFHQPALVLCDIQCLETLPQDIFLDGCAEVIKYGILYDADLFRHLEQYGPDFDRDYVITRCVELKNEVVSRDEFDRGERQMLNLGHTIGHGIERCSGYEIRHGSAVGTGMAIISRCAAQMGLCSPETASRILNILKKFGFSLSCRYSASELAHVALSDKKRSAGTVSMIVPQQIGSCRIYPVSVDGLEKFIQAGV